MNWGKSIIAGMIVFMLFILAMFIKMMNSNTDDYDHQYYEKGLTFDTDYAKEKQVVTDKAGPQISIVHDSLKVQFITAARGELNFVRPADNRMDRSVTFHTGVNGLFATKLHLAASGRWQLVFNWQSNSKKYLYQKEVYIP